MTDEQINRTIAESLGWRLVNATFQEPVGTSAYWLWIPPNSTKNVGQPNLPSFLTDPAMRDLLQAKLLEEGWIITITPYDNAVFGIELSKDGEEELLVGGKVRERLMADAYIAYLAAKAS